MSWEVDVTLNATAAGLELPRVAGNVAQDREDPKDGYADRNQAQYVLSFAASALGSPLRSDGSPGANLGKDNDTYRVQAQGDGKSMFSLIVNREFLV